MNDKQIRRDAMAIFQWNRQPADRGRKSPVLCLHLLL
jgi:hypothetical protein